MTKSPTTQTSEPQIPQPLPARRWSFLVFLFRVLLLGVGGLSAGLLGVAIAHFYPAQVENPPFLEDVFRQTHHWLIRLRELPQMQNRDDIQPAASSSPSQSISPAAHPDSLPQSNSLAVTLPSDSLFLADQATLRGEAKPILDAIVGELKRYPGSTIRIAGYTDDGAETGTTRTSQESRSRSLAQAEAIQQYLAAPLGDQFRWVAIGYGHSQPLAKSTAPTDRQRDRRIEITLDPQ